MTATATKRRSIPQHLDLQKENVLQGISEETDVLHFMDSGI
jgi:hypothetical protein